MLTVTDVPPLVRQRLLLWSQARPLRSHAARTHTSQAPLMFKVVDRAGHFLELRAKNTIKVAKVLSGW